MQEPPGRFTSVQLDALKEINSIGAGNASTVLAQFIAKKIDMSPPQVLEVSSRRVQHLISGENPNLMMVILGIEGAVEGHIMLIAEYTNAQYIIDILMGRELEVRAAALSELEISSLKEVSSVMSGSFLRVISETLNTVLKMTPPDYIAGRPENILDLIIKHCLWDGESTICLKSDLWIVVENRRLLMHLLFIPLASSMGPLLKFLGMEVR